MVLPPAAFEFPDVETANPHGLLALGGDFRWDHLVRAYALGIFPWSSAHEPIAWFAPDPRSVLPPSELRVQRSMRPLLNRGAFRVTYDRAFARVLRACAKRRVRDRTAPGCAPTSSADSSNCTAAASHTPSRLGTPIQAS